ncbi:hypothetical protein LX32DRAFT_602267 [Colletotrichum zoysiae]|uniref:Uncharacterized protein n=1 Tax=Colletotrichum zoysiae TaxID=1216348 RepID=A0AAD9H5X7_9PEZI|nr:hypothetical protein LX32DRAFT_602267 [Colletotrichum zoysiae]
MARHLGKEVIIYTNGDSSLASGVSAMVNNPFSFGVRMITQMRVAGGRQVTPHQRHAPLQGFLAHRPFINFNGPFAEQLGL